jgi:hypothetical protein
MARLSILIFAALLLAAGTANLLVAVLAIQPPNSPRLPTTVNVFGSEAAAKGWPVTPPDPWPAVTQWSQEGSYANRRQTAWSQNQTQSTTHQMQVDFYGWPFPALRRTQLWASQDHSPRWSPKQSVGGAGAPGASGGTSRFVDTGLAPHWPGVVANPLLLALITWLVCVAPIILGHRLRRALRIRRGLCPACGYPAGVSGVCSECGVDLPTRSALPRTA